jgi:hypothetical protein
MLSSSCKTMKEARVEVEKLFAAIMEETEVNYDRNSTAIARSMNSVGVRHIEVWVAIERNKIKTIVVQYCKDEAGDWRYHF